MGQSWNKVIFEQKKQFVEEFKMLLVCICVSVFVVYSEQCFDYWFLCVWFIDIDVMVQVCVIQVGVQFVFIDYSMGKIVVGWKVCGVMVGGVGLVVNYCIEFNSMVCVLGVGGLFKNLWVKNCLLEEKK